VVTYICTVRLLSNSVLYIPITNYDMYACYDCFVNILHFVLKVCFKTPVNRSSSVIFSHYVRLQWSCLWVVLANSFCTRNYTLYMLMNKSFSSSFCTLMTLRCNFTTGPYTESRDTCNRGRINIKVTDNFENILQLDPDIIYAHKTALICLGYYFNCKWLLLSRILERLSRLRMCVSQFSGQIELINEFELLNVKHLPHMIYLLKNTSKKCNIPVAIYFRLYEDCIWFFVIITTLEYNLQIRHTQVKLDSINKIYTYKTIQSWQNCRSSILTV